MHHNWIGLIGAYLAWSSFLPFGIAAYLLPFLLALFGVALSAEFSQLSARTDALVDDLVVVLLISLTGLLYHRG